jgi:hypothetical protein
MELLEFARGPALTFAITVFIAGSAFRIVSLFLMWRTRDSSEGSNRERPAVVAAFREIIRRLWPQSAYKQRTLFMLINGYVFHIGLAIIVFFLLPHILFFKDLLGLSWPSLPNNVIYAISIITTMSLIAALVMRMSNPAQRIISTFDTGSVGWLRSCRSLPASLPPATWAHVTRPCWACTFSVSPCS